MTKFALVDGNTEPFKDINAPINIHIQYITISVY